jgi:predicted ATPase/class 3 adenylate cyclase
MTIALPGYQILALVHESTNSIVYRVRREEDDRTFICKILKEDYPTHEGIARYKQEYEITRNLNIEGAIEAYDLQKAQNSLVALLEDFNGRSLKSWLQEKKFSLSEFLTIAVRVTKILGEIHAANVIHKDINPSNILFDPDTGQVKIIDFGIATVLSRENPTLQNPDTLEGTLPYLSPEQTGRMNRSLDYRTDFYSLGATFYELLLDRPPFDSTDAMELVHCHIAKQPVSPSQIDSRVPEAISHIVLKLLAKTAEDRYQSAYGLKADLEYCLTQLQTTGTIEAFPLSRHDISDKFQIPQKLYGREREIDSLLQAFDRVSRGQSELMLVSGYSGIGKSALIKEIYKPITTQRGYFISGKFDQFQRNIPYSAILSALRGGVQQLLTESETQLATWREQLIAALGDEGQALVAAIPEIELIAGKQPPVPKLAPAEAQNRLNRLLREVIRIFCQPTHPLVIFLDDLQWADSATLNLLEGILTDMQTGYLFVIGEYRDNEVSPDHPLMMTLDNLHHEGVTLEHLELTPLDLDCVTQLIADTLHSDRQRVRPLAELVVRKTQGNPFFANEFLKTLYEEQLLVFRSPDSGDMPGWHWDTAQIEALDITDNVVELTIAKLKKLPESTQQVLSLAACLGDRFDLQTLSVILEKSVSDTFSNLFCAVQEGLVLPLSNFETTEYELADSQLFILHYKFPHDRVRQAAYALMDEVQQQQIHLKIGRMLRLLNPIPQQTDKIFEVVDHLNIARDWFEHGSETIDLARLNLEAGRKAKQANAYRPASQYFQMGLDVLADPNLESCYDLTFNLHKEQADIEYLNGNLERSEALIRTTLEWARSPLERAELYNMLIVQYTMTSRYALAAEAGKSALDLLGIALPENLLKETLTQELHYAEQQLQERSIASLIEQPEMTAKDKQMAIRVLMNMASPVYISNQDTFLFTILKIVNISLEYGHTPESAYGYSSYGIILGSILGDYRGGYEFGKLALDLSDRFNILSEKCKTRFVFCYTLNHWLNHLKTNDPISEEGYRAGLESGELQFAGYTLIQTLLNLYNQGENLNRILERVPNWVKFIQKTHNQIANDALTGCELAMWNLTGRTDSKLAFNNDRIDDAAFLERCRDRQSFTTICRYLILKTQVLYLYNETELALECAQEADRSIAYILGHFQRTEHHFYYSLCLCDRYPHVGEQQQQTYWQRLEANQAQMKIWSENCPENFEHKYLLVAAEMARITDRALVAMDLYDRAIEGARNNEFLQDEALANELAAKFWRDRGKTEFARLYLTNARYNYQLWGAKRKVEELEQSYPQLLARHTTRGDREAVQGRTIVSTSSSSGALDLATVTKASQAIFGEIVLDRLLAKLMKILIENAGAQFGYLILEQEGKLLVEAKGSVESDRVEVLRSLPIDSTKNGNTPIVPLAIINYVARTKESVVLNDATREGKFTKDPYIIHNEPQSILCAPLIDRGKLSGIVYLENNLTTGAFTPDRLEVLHLLSAQAAISIQNARFYTETARLKTAYERFVPRQFLQFLDKESILDVKLGDQVQKEMSVLFADIRAFTTLSEKMSPEENFRFINSYLSRMEPAIIQHKGFVDKYIGDGIMALFGGDADDAVQAGIAMLRSLAEYNGHRASVGYEQVQIGIGINTGSLMLGTVGGHSRMDSTVISDAVNLASRLEGLTKLYEVSMLISHQTFARLHNPAEYSFRIVERLKVKGKSEPVAVFEIFDGDDPELKAAKLATSATFEQALMFYYRNCFAEAAEGFQSCLEQNPRDKVAQIYLKRCRQYG